MSVPAAISAELAELLQALQSADNNVRSQAEDYLQNNWTATRPEMLLMGLVGQIAESQDATVRHHTLCKRHSVTAPRLTLLPTGTLLRCCHIPTNRLQDEEDGDI
jgi:hypothetical protein